MNEQRNFRAIDGKSAQGYASAPPPTTPYPQTAECSPYAAAGQIAGGMACEQAYGNSKSGLGFTFSEALERLKSGRNMRRDGWNGIGQYVFLWHGVDDSARHERASHLNAIRSDLFGLPAPGERTIMRGVRMMPHFRIATGQSGPVATWVPSVTDLLAEDWHQV